MLFAKDGNEAFDKIVQYKPDVALLDVIMPHLDGIGVLEKLNAVTLEKISFLCDDFCGWSRQDH